MPWYQVYEFVADRLRSVRQDMVIQNLSVQHSILLLQPIVKFYAFAPYQLCEEGLSRFDPVLNGKHFLECTKKLLTLYDIRSCKNPEDYLTDRGFYEGLYVLWNLGDTEALLRGMSVPLW